MAWAYLAVPLVLLVVFFFVPMASALWMSMHDYSHALFAPDFVGWDNYGKLLFGNEHFWQVVHNTATFMLMVVPAMMVLPIPVAILLNQSVRGITVFRAAIYLPVVLSLVVAGIAWKWLYASEGLFNYGLSLLGLPKVDWLIAPDVALFAVALMVVWKGLGYYMLMYLASLQSIPGTLYEAAEMDGASPVATHWHVTVPFLRPTMALVAIISTIGGLKVFTEIYVMTRGGPVGATETLVYYIYDQAFANLNLGTACAAGFLLMVVIFALSLIHIHTFYLKAEREAGVY
ncbi:MAG: sugar ABC transporter permease [Cyanobacteria bacterium HKST-UBA06]|nr:sugar ABC transporter permease [Cyanobacteria bacterium HKST-UBA04]MCA9807161.1 sugar ABC transporter permease [Cyanobacteria bacterium HKST-UBA06]MCA9841541.1 sugar ABC transporter permease [Cyanobacteria bacterium HKST-UBA03]